MKYSRRDLSLLLPVIAAANATAEEGVLASKVYRFEDLPVRGPDTWRSRAIFSGKTHTNYAVDLHHSELAAGVAPHPPHQHVHEEVLLIIAGTLEVMMANSTQTVGAGSVVYFASNQKHGWRNPGPRVAQYFVLALGGDQA
jgi:mannose-6-phosphate isomerase-like protein (cupin superfamily)